MRDGLIAATKKRRFLGLFVLGLGVLSVSLSLGIASWEKAAAKRPVASQTGRRAGIRWEVAGVVLDSQSNPISNAFVSAWNQSRQVRTEADKTGHFKLPNVLRQGGHLYVQANGFRFGGITIEPDAKNIQIKLTRASEPAMRVLHTLPDLPSLKQAYDSLRNHFGPFAKKCIAAAEKTDRLRPLEVLACVEPAWVLQYLQTNGFENAWFTDYVRWAAAKVLLDQNMDDALAIVHSFENPMWRSMGCVEVVDVLPDTQHAKKLSLLAEALLQARAVEAPDKQLSILSRIAGHFLDLGQIEQATRILREGHETAKTLPTKEWPGYARGCLAQELARIDLKAAMALVTGYEDDFDHDRHHGNIAHKLAEKDPVSAQRVLDMMRTEYNRGQWSSRVCYHMTPIDADRAREIANAIDAPCIRAHALGMMAQSLSDSDKPLASKLVQEAFVVLDGLVSNRPDGRMPKPQDVALSLLPVVESINVELVNEYLWHTLSLGKEPRALTAACLARYDRDIAAKWLPPGKSASPERSEFYFAALALIDPEVSVRQAKSLPEISTEDQQAKMRAWTQIIAILRRSTQERWEWIQEERMNLWYVGKEDI
jgi:hypothetical protein